MRTKTENILNAPPFRWEALTNRQINKLVDLGESVRELDTMLERAMRLREYLDYRHAGVEHGGAVTASNKGVAKLRKVLGYSQHRNDLAF